MSSQAMALIRGIWPDFPATEKDLRSPSQEFLMKFYELFFDECSLLDLRMQIPLGTLYPESLNDALPIISTCVFLSYMSSHWRGPQVGLEDIIDPSPRKTWKLLENFANYVIYVDTHSGNLALEAYDSVSQTVEEKDKLTQEIDEIKEKLNEIAMRRAESSSELRKLDNQLLKNAELRNSVEVQCLQAEDEFKSLDDALTEQKLEISNLEREYEKELEEINCLREKIVTSPDTVSRAIVELSAKKREMESDQAHLRTRAKQMVLLDSNLEQIASMIRSKLPQVDELAANLIFLRDLENGLKEDDAAVKSVKEKFDADAGRYQSLEKDIAHLDQEINQFKVQIIEEQAALEESIQRANLQKEEAEQKQIKLGAHKVIVAQEIHQWKEEEKDLEREEQAAYKRFYEMEENMYSLVRGFSKWLNEEAENISR